MNMETLYQWVCVILLACLIYQAIRIHSIKEKLRCAAMSAAQQYSDTLLYSDPKVFEDKYAWIVEWRDPDDPTKWCSKEFPFL